mmetsp:Transcript_2469/g.8403  ORF Transcript_2469/g.8403 Transcript_2469/m.8403 type:complete len:279 (+) Transcript_2469:1411-2247(+)
MASTRSTSVAVGLNFSARYSSRDAYTGLPAGESSLHVDCSASPMRSKLPLMILELTLDSVTLSGRKRAASMYRSKPSPSLNSLSAGMPLSTSRKAREMASSSLLSISSSSLKSESSSPIIVGGRGPGESVPLVSSAPSGIVGIGDGATTPSDSSMVNLAPACVSISDTLMPESTGGAASVTTCLPTGTSPGFTGSESLSMPHMSAASPANTGLCPISSGRGSNALSRGIVPPAVASSSSSTSAASRDGRSPSKGRDALNTNGDSRSPRVAAARKRTMS